MLASMLDKGKQHVFLKVPYSDGRIVDLLTREAFIEKQEYTDDGIEINAVVTPDVFGKIKKYIPDYTEPTEDWE